MKRAERITAILVAAAGIAIMYHAWHTLKFGSVHVPDAGFLPFLCGAALVILGILRMLLLLWAGEAKGAPPAEKRMRFRPYASLALMVLYALAMEQLGYISSTFLFVIAWEQAIEREKWVKTILIALLATVAMYALFKLFLKVPIPEELFLR